jgi:hypothetical protein
MNVRRSMLALVVAIGAVLIAASPAFADFGSDPDEPFVVLTGALVVPNASAVSDAIIFAGTTILGDVDGQGVAVQRRYHGLGERDGQCRPTAVRTAGRRRRRHRRGSSCRSHRPPVDGHCDRPGAST